MNEYNELLKYTNVNKFLIDNTSLQNQEAIYLLYVLNFFKYEDNIRYFVNVLFKRYKFNYNIVKKYINIIPYNKSSILSILNKKKSIFLFEEIDLDNINFYLVIWQDLHC